MALKIKINAIYARLALHMMSMSIRVILMPCLKTGTVHTLYDGTIGQFIGFIFHFILYEITSQCEKPGLTFPP